MTQFAIFGNRARSSAKSLTEGVDDSDSRVAGEPIPKFYRLLEMFSFSSLGRPIVFVMVLVIIM